MSRDDYDYDSDLEIDPDNLDLECLRQPRLFKKYSEEPVFARREADRAHEKLKTIRSELVLEVTDDPSLAGVEKATGPVIEAYYRTHKKYKKAKETWMDAEEKVELLKIAPFAFNHKKAVLGYLVQLNGQNYFASPSVPQELGEKMRENSKKAGKKHSRDKIRKRKRQEED